MSDDGSDIAGEAGTIRVRPRGTFDTKRGIPYFLDVSGKAAQALTRRTRARLSQSSPSARSDPDEQEHVVLYDGPR